MDVSSIVAGYLPAVVSVVTVVGAVIAMMSNVKNIVGDTKAKDKKIVEGLAEQNKKIDEAITQLVRRNTDLETENCAKAIEIQTLKEQNALLQEQNKSLKEQNETLNTIKDQQAVVMDRLRKE